MNRPGLNEFPATDSRTYKLLIKVVYEDYDWKRFAIDQAKYIEQEAEEKKALTEALKAIKSVANLGNEPLFKAIHDIANKTPKL